MNSWMLPFLLVGAGGALGAVARYAVGDFLHKHVTASFPLGTLAVNVLGCFAIGAVLFAADDAGTLGHRWRLFLAVGVLGGFTTFSAFGHETLALIRSDRLGWALVNVATNVMLGFAAVWLGRWVMK